jgi:glycosyltransferase involved in cell wall biosynthesis
MNKVYLSIVMPAYNEAGNIAKAVERACATGKKYGRYEVIVVDDGSRDQTAGIVNKLKEKDTSIHLIRHQRNIGYGGAVYDGLKAARGEYIFLTDSDLQFDLAAIDKFIKSAEKYDVVVGYRQNRAEGFARKFNMVVWNLLIRFSIGLKVKDIDCAFKLFSKKVIDAIEVDSRGAMFSAELMYRIYESGFSVLELPVKHFPRSNGKATGADVKVIIRAVRELKKFKKRNRKL